jgi:hypothetical protein
MTSLDYADIVELKSNKEMTPAEKRLTSLKLGDLDDSSRGASKDCRQTANEKHNNQHLTCVTNTEYIRQSKGYGC